MSTRMIGLVAAAMTLAATALADGHGSTDNRRAQLDAAMPDLMAEHGVPAVGVALIEDGEIVFATVYGEQSAGVPATGKTLFNVASMAKPVTAEVVLRLASKGLLDLDESMSAHYVDPDLVDDPRAAALTPAIALSHRTGFSNWRSQTGGVLTIQFEPGSRAGYSGEGYNYVGRFVEEKLGEDFVTLLNREVLGPIGLENMSLTGQPWFEGRIALPHGPEGTPGEPSINEAWSGADDLYTTVEDYARFIITVMDGAPLSPEVRERRFTLPVNMMEQGCPWPPNCPTAGGFALGWAVFEYEDGRVVTQGGADWGERAVSYFMPETRSGVIIMTNSVTGGPVIRDVSALLGAAPEPFQAFLEFQS